MTPDGIPIAYLVISRAGVTAVAVPVERCDESGEDLPIDHEHHRMTRLENLREAPHQHRRARRGARMSRYYSPVVALLDAIERRLKAWGRGRVTIAVIAAETLFLILLPVLPGPAWAVLLPMIVFAFIAVTALVITSGEDQ